MAATIQQRPRALDQQRSWDPIIRPIAVATLSVLLILNSLALGAMNFARIPNTVPLLLGFGGIALSFVVPRREKVIIPVAPTLLLVLILCSVAWTHNPDLANVWLRSDGLMIVAIACLSLVLPNRDVITSFKIFVGFVLAVTLVAVSIDPLARTHIDPTGEAPQLAGWHGWFVHKNTMAGFMIVALPTAMAFYRSRTARWAAYVAIIILMAGSDSTTGRSALIVQVAVAIWFTFNRRLSGRGSATFAVSTFAVLIVAAIAVVSSLAAIADAAGKDLTFTGRTQIWSAVIDKIGDQPVFGHGIRGIFGVPKTPETMEVIRAIGFPAGHSHNGLLDVALQVGVVGVVIVIAQIVRLFRSSLAQMARSKATPLFALALASGLCVMAVGESTLLDSSLAVVFCAQAMLLRTARTNRERSKAAPRSSAGAAL